MPGGTTKQTAKKTVKKKVPVKKRVAKKTSVKKGIAKTRKKTAPKKVVKKVTQKINLKTKTVTTIKAKKKAQTKKAKVEQKNIQKDPIIKIKGNSQKNKKNIIKLEKIKKRGVKTSEAKILTEKVEKDKQFLMWALVSFFMILIIIFWIYNTKESIERSRVEWQSSEKAMTWSQMADELSDKIVEIKNDIEAVRSFASSSVEQGLPTENRSELFQASASSSNLIESEVIEDLKHDLEIKTGVSEPLAGEYDFLIDPENEKILLASLAEIKIGNDIEQVKTILDEPSLEQELKDQRGVFIAKILSYYIKIYKEDTVSEKYDRYISLEFDQDDILVKINKFLD